MFGKLALAALAMLSLGAHPLLALVIAALAAH